MNTEAIENSRGPRVLRLQNIDAFISREIVRVHLAFAWLKLSLKLKTLTSKRRRQALRWLRLYWMRGVYPKNIHSVETTPVFRDEFGNLCAVANLVWHDGASKTVDKISLANNGINLTAEHNTELAAWAAGNGLTYDEVAFIQPAYGYQTAEPSINIVEFIIMALLLLPLYIAVIGTYLVVGKRLLERGSRARRFVNTSAVIGILAILIGVAMAWLYLSSDSYRY